MLILSRYEGESIYIGDDIQITVFETKNGQVFLGIDAPKEIPVHRAEIYYRNKHLSRKVEAHQTERSTTSARPSNTGNGNEWRQNASANNDHSVSDDGQNDVNGNVRPGYDSDGNQRSDHNGEDKSNGRRGHTTRVNFRSSRRYPPRVSSRNPNEAYSQKMGVK